MRFINGELLRFLIAGGLNTVLTYFIYLFLLNSVSYRLAFSLSFVAGIVIAFGANSLYVFGASLRWRKLVPYAFLYAVQYVVGLVTLSTLVEFFGLDKRIAPIVSVAVMAPVNFLINRRFLTSELER